MSDKIYELILRNCRFLQPNYQLEIVDIAIDDGRITAIYHDIPASAQKEIEIEEKLVTPPFIESHIHLDSTLTAGKPRWNQSGTLFEGIEIWGEQKQKLTIEDVKKRAIETIKNQAKQGVLFVRTHVDVSEPTLTALQALLEVKETVKDWINLQIVAFPQDGIYSQDENLTFLETALQLGVDGVGGIPHYEFTREDGVKSIHHIFDLAEQYDCFIDIHCDEIDDDQSRFLEVVAACAIRTGLTSQVTASHTTAFASYNNAYAFKLMSLLEKSKINFVANPLINITLQGRNDTYPKRRGVTRVKELWQNGLNVSFGHDCVQDPWYNLGTGNMLDVAYMGVHICQMTGIPEINACYQMITRNGAKTLDVEDRYGIEVGKPGNLIVLDAKNPFHAIRKRATVKYVFSQGKLLAETTPTKIKFVALT
ncbi:cytosine deaminase [Hydrocoleum sp. CS-953]|uniref:cytosine deaminase n=2 Tax=Hydrocoleum sp. CS-953 TaxID=1671698 RepID=UPI000B9BADAA|nr:cytosine deaminase [Hydrocoleum sp. CS-953]OZH54860.1 cytosine deaminase [Hydrocoleum sp. CS-953]